MPSSTTCSATYRTGLVCSSSKTRFSECRHHRPGPATDEDVRNIVGEHLDRLEHPVASALAEQDDHGSRTALSAVQRGLLDHQRPLREIAGDSSWAAPDATPDTTTH
jgi:hypothetical protein